ncbi:MAG: glycosyl hydrolase family 18 protein [Acidaminococcaceae bacterium]
MNKVLKNSIRIILLSLVLFLIAGCYNGKQANVKAAGQTKNQLSVWTVYWDAEEGSKEFGRFEKRLDEVCLFGAYFEEDGNLFLPEELTFDKRVAKKKKQLVEYLTIVNDRVLSDGGKEYKKTEFLQELLNDQERRKEHIDEIIALAKAEHFDGVEIDYERVWKDCETKDSFVPFIKELYAATTTNDLKLRVVLEPGTPFNDIELPVGPKYVVMLYNLYGMHSGPGAKADSAFIKKVLGKMVNMPEPKAVAFATGGCMWNSDGEKKFITEKEARQLLEQYKTDAKRDAGSKAVTFKYREGTTVCEVWYADAATLDYWISLAEDAGVRDIAIWRLGSNETLNKIKRLD